MKKAHLASCFALVSLIGINQFARAADSTHSDQPIVSPADAISKLKEGNARFTAGNMQHPHESNDERKYMAANSYENACMTVLGMRASEVEKRRTKLAKTQHPFTSIVMISVSPSLPETVFEHGIVLSFSVCVD